MQKEIVLASSNKKKIEELTALLPDFKILSLKDIGFYDTIEEPFFTFRENAAIKAQTIARFCGKMVLSDDSGLCVDALNGAPGVFSARYAGAEANDLTNLEKLLSDLSSENNRAAHYIAVLCLVTGDEIHFFEGRCDGVIRQAPQGTNGFGYDPIFQPNGYEETFGQLHTDVKKQISHRAQAMGLLKAYFGGL